MDAENEAGTSKQGKIRRTWHLLKPKKMGDQKKGKGWESPFSGTGEAICTREMGRKF